MDILIVTGRPESFYHFAPALAREEADVSFAPDGQAALARVGAEPPTLVVVDRELPDAAPFALVARLMEANAAVQTAVVSDLPAEAFHEAGEGLGILTALPSRLAAEDARGLLQALRRTA